MNARTATITRNTAETQISVSINLDGTGQGVLDTGVPFLDHMLAKMLASPSGKHSKLLWATKKASAVMGIFMRHLMRA